MMNVFVRMFMLLCVALVACVPVRQTQWAGYVADTSDDQAGEVPSELNWEPLPQDTKPWAAGNIMLMDEGEGVFLTELMNPSFDGVETNQVVGGIVIDLDPAFVARIVVDAAYGGGGRPLLGDVSGDGLDDILFPARDPQQPDWALSAGYLVAQSPIQGEVLLTEHDFVPSAEAAGIIDLDGDGSSELVPVNYGEATLSMYPAVQRGDVTGDGRPDLVAIDVVTMDLVIVPANEPEGSLAIWRMKYQQGGIASISIADFNGDEQLDLAVVSAEDALQVGPGVSVYTPRIWLGPIDESVTWDDAVGAFAWPENVEEFVPAELVGPRPTDGDALCYAMAGSASFGRDGRANMAIAEVCNDGRRPEILLEAPGWADVWIGADNSEIVNGRLVVGVTKGLLDPESGYRPQPQLMFWDLP